MDGVGLSQPMPITVTFFPDFGASSKREQTLTLDELAAVIRTTTKPQKDQLPWLKLARFGDVTTEKLSLRHDANMPLITGIEGDYDGEVMLLDTAMEIAAKADLLCLVYTSPSHTEDTPRWRILCPTSEELPAARRSALFGRINGLFNGIFSGESWTLSQSYYFGSTNSNPSHQVAVIDGTPIDLLDDLDEVWRGKPNTSTATDADGTPRQGPLDEDALLREMRSGDNYHQASVRLLGRWALKGVPLMDARQRLVEGMEAVAPPNRDGRWRDRRDDIDRCVADIYVSEAKARDAGTSRRRDLRQSPQPTGQLEPLDPTIWLARPPAREWIVPDWIPRGVVTGFYGDGGTGKSLAAMQLITAMALGKKWFGLDVAPGRALGVFCEDDEAEMQRRQWDINRVYGAGPAQLNGARYLCRLGADNALITFDGQDVGTPTAFAEQLDQLCAENKPDLLVLDTIADLFPANENDRAKVRQFVQGSLGGLARRHSCAVLVLGHPSVTGLNTGTGQSGSTAWNNTFRSRFYLTREVGEEADPSIRILTRKKANYAARDAELKLRWTDGAFALAAAAAPPGKGGDVSWEQIEQIFDEIERAWQAGRPWSHRPEVRRDGRMIQVWAHEHFRIPEKRLNKLISSWLMEGLTEYPTFEKGASFRGLKVIRRLASV